MRSFSARFVCGSRMRGMDETGYQVWRVEKGRSPIRHCHSERSRFSGVERNLAWIGTTIVRARSLGPLEKTRTFSPAMRFRMARNDKLSGLILDYNAPS